MEIEPSDPHYNDKENNIVVRCISGYRNDIICYLPLSDWFGSARQPLKAHSLLNE
jgi:hypothetical protein